MVLRDVANSRVIECFLHSHAAVEGDSNKYVVAIPADPCIDICVVSEGTDELVTVDPDDAEMDKIFPIAKQMLAEDDLELVRSATTLTLQGDLELDSDDEDDDDEEGEYPDEELASFEVSQRHILLLTYVP